MKDFNYVDSNGNTINVSVMGFFRVPELEKEFIMYAFVDDVSDNPDGRVLLGKVIRENDNMQILGIDSNEKDLVVAYYNEVITQLGGNEDE